MPKFAGRLTQVQAEDIHAYLIKRAQGRLSAQLHGHGETEMMRYPVAALLALAITASASSPLLAQAAGEPSAVIDPTMRPQPA